MIKCSSLPFLASPCSYAASLQPAKTVTTAAIYLKNVCQFMTYFQETPPKECRLTRGQIVGVIRALKASTANMNTPVLLHQLKVKSDKVSRETLRTCQWRAKATIPKILGESAAFNKSGVQDVFFGLT